ncbi:hypothetical protein BG006_010625 [Podila minutissima]|uniref:Uncharacterized protein n=1 Tax=Podila minutissima TaxID=64525 RepID=A0A9P5SCY0_9FUNG|nr:hypothetical protein BG006_010625 [Podila minutissima]
MAIITLCVFMLLVLSTFVRPTAAHYDPKDVDIEVIPCSQNGVLGDAVSTYVEKGACVKLPGEYRGKATCKIRVAPFVGGGYGGKECPRYRDSACKTSADFGDYFVCHGPPPKP